MIRQDDVFKIGRIGKTHGVNGEVAFYFDNDVFDRTDADYVILSINDILVPFFIEEYRFRSDETALLKLCDIDTQQQAAELTGCDVYFPRSLAGDADFSFPELIGYSVVDANGCGRIVGRIADVDDATLNVLFVLEDGTLLPAADELIETIDKDKRTLTMRVPAGLLN